MGKFKKVNNITGWIVFAISAVVYLLTIEPTASFWDCGEFIATAFKQEVGHPPGAPLFMMIARFFTLFASDVTKVAALVNAMSALASAFTILFLFWTITHLARKLIIKDAENISTGNLVAVMASGVVGALAYTFSDTFWFSAVEGEVYAMSSFFTAIVFWAMLKWEEVADEPHSNRWLIFIAYMMGLSIGVHLLNLLTIPALAFIYYYKKYKPTRNGIFVALLVSAVILVAILYIIIPGTFKLGSLFELMFVNGFGLPYFSGLIFYFILLFTLIAWGIYNSHKKKKVLLNTVLVSVAAILIGYSSYGMIILRANANTPINENNPSNVFSLINYLNREQYGDRPLFYGQYYNAPVTGSKDKTTRIPKNGKYVETYLKTTYNFDDQFKTIFPRMYSPQGDHVEEYKKWANIEGRPIKVRNQNGEEEIRNVPTFGENLLFFFRYQVGHMYMRYFMWNFVGRQDDVQSNGGIEHGNWISGIKPIDAIFLGNQNELTDNMKNHPSRNTYYFLPLILGLIGIYYQLFTKRDRRNSFVVFLLFFLTGLAIVVYLNQTPLQPRERDYAYAGSFYAFTIWIGLGVLAVYEWIQKIAPSTASAAAAGMVCLSVPIIMGTQNWDDHDRSGRYTARDFAANYLNSCAPNAILFTNGDNDTFPLWYAQEVEGIRTDVRVVNLSLLGTDWYIDQMKCQCYDSKPLPISMKHEQYVQGTRDIVYIYNRLNDTVELKNLLNFVLSDDKSTKLQIPGESPIDYIPASRVKVSVNKAAVIKNGTVNLKDSSLIVSSMAWSLKGQYLQKSALAILDIITNNNWERPIYFVSPYGDGDIGIADYLQLEGFAYRLVPIKTSGRDFLSVGRIDTDILYNNLMNKFSWGRMNEPDVFIDYNNQRTAIVLKLRNTFSRLAQQLISEGKKDSALVVLDKITKLMPHEKYPYDFFMFDIAEAYYKLNQTETANKILDKYADVTLQSLRYQLSLGDKYRDYNNYDLRLNIQTLQELASLADSYGQVELKTKIENGLNQHYSKLVNVK
ncbi:MAG TPA: DUF2723 domain-containing protein [Tenuifilaceae bacterium]|nr:DUF2723 domain-containing protein [Bacteroidales bacterium]HNY08586.1 DUF2723 domain-containing protein [Tenuifilaceae bacterium]NLI86768.1 DUF2723 domain-containing protein [Bacteroidales bacterium]HOC36128.1 DUF2723 domain-containing protein [Tenuifilaceae bacterium]HOG71867.1 DUF2723 domain-containing protein [Tenuifilaceae bacterium]